MYLYREWLSYCGIPPPHTHTHTHTEKYSLYTNECGSDHEGGLVGHRASTLYVPVGARLRRVPDRIKANLLPVRSAAQLVTVIWVAFYRPWEWWLPLLMKSNQFSRTHARGVIAEWISSLPLLTWLIRIRSISSPVWWRLAYGINSSIFSIRR